MPFVFILMFFSFSFIERYRIPPHLVIQLIGELSPYIGDDEDGAIPLHLRVLAALNFYGGGGYQRRVGMDGFDMLSQSMVSKSINEISRVLTDKLGPEYIKFPQSQDEIDMIKERFFEDYEIEGVLGIVDGTHILIAGLPLGIRNSYIGHKVNRPTVNTQFIIDSDMRVLSVNARYPGSAHDTLVWHNSKVFTLLEKKFNLDDQSDNIYRDSFLLGDGGYPLQPWLMVPVKDPSPDQINEKRYNKKQRQMRNKIERFNACFKNRFRCFLGCERGLRYSHEKVGYMIYACAVLHNFLIANSFDDEYIIPQFIDSEEGNGDDDFIDDEVDGMQNGYLARGEVVRRELIAKYFST